MSFKDNDEERGMHLAGENIEIMNNDKANEIIEELFQSFRSICIKLDWKNYLKVVILFLIVFS